MRQDVLHYCQDSLFRLVMFFCKTRAIFLNSHLRERCRERCGCEARHRGGPCQIQNEREGRSVDGPTSSTDRCTVRNVAAASAMVAYLQFSRRLPFNPPMPHFWDMKFRRRYWGLHHETNKWSYAPFSLHRLPVLFTPQPHACHHSRLKWMSPLVSWPNREDDRMKRHIVGLTETRGADVCMIGR